MIQDAPGYEFLDCGKGRRLERLGGVVTDRPAPGALHAPGLPPERWREASLSFHRDGGWRGEAPVDWRQAFGPALMELHPAAAGGVGAFPEHDAVCDRMEALLDSRPAPVGGWRILNLFAHTGLATLRLAARGDASLVHVDAAAAAVRRARANALLSGLDDRPVRWLVDDALAFCAREIRRGVRYHLVLADPPAFGRGGKAGEWKLDRDLPELLRRSGLLLGDDALGLCLTCHSDGWTAARCERAVRSSLPRCGRVDSMDLVLRASGAGTPLPSGCCVTALTR